MKIPTQIWIFCVGIFLQHYTFLQKRTFCILCEKFFHFVRKATSVLAYFESGEKIMENRNNTVWCGTRGVIKYVCEIRWDKQKCYKRAAIGSNPVRSAIF